MTASHDREDRSRLIADTSRRRGCRRPLGCADGGGHDPRQRRGHNTRWSRPHAAHGRVRRAAVHGGEEPGADRQRPRLGRRHQRRGVAGLQDRLPNRRLRAAGHRRQHRGVQGVRHFPDSRRCVGRVGVGARRLERAAGREAVRPPQPHRIRGGPQLLRGAKGGAPGAQHLLRFGLAPQQRRQPPAGEDHGQQRGLGGGTRSQHRERVPPGPRCGQPDPGQRRQCAGDHGVHGSRRLPTPPAGR